MYIVSVSKAFLKLMKTFTKVLPDSVFNLYTLFVTVNTIGSQWVATIVSSCCAMNPPLLLTIVSHHRSFRRHRCS